MTDGLNRRQVKFLQWLIYFLLAVLTFISAWSKYESSVNAERISNIECNMPDKYVLLERYNSDKSALTCSIDNVNASIIRLEDKFSLAVKSIDNKIDKMIEREILINKK